MNKGYGLMIGTSVSILVLLEYKKNEGWIQNKNFQNGKIRHLDGLKIFSNGFDNSITLFPRRFEKEVL